MLEHKIVPGYSTIYKKEGSMFEALYSYRPAGVLSHLLTTPEILVMIIEGTNEMLDPLLPEGYTTVVKHLELSHEHPTLTLMGGTINIILTVTEVIGNKVYLNFNCHDEIGLICSGKYERAIVNKDKLMEVTYRRAQSKM